MHWSLAKSNKNLEKLTLGHAFLVLLDLVLLGLSLVPLVSHLLLPVWLLLDVVDPVLNDSECLSDLEVLHILLIVQLIGKLKQLIDFLFLGVFLLFFGGSPRGFRFRFGFLRRRLRRNRNLRLHLFKGLLSQGLKFTLFSFLEVFDLVPLVLGLILELFNFELLQLVRKHGFLALLILSVLQILEETPVFVQNAVRVT